LTGQVELVAKLAASKPELWNDSAQAQTFVDDISQELVARIMLLDAQGNLLASSDPTDESRLGEGLDLPPLADVLAGEMSVRTAYSRHLHGEIADVFFPVFGPDQRIIGVIRLSHRLVGVREQFLRLRYFIVGILITGLLLGTGIGLLLALNMENPLRRVTRAIQDLAGGEHISSLIEQGPAEIRLLLREVNTLVERLKSLEQARRQLLANLVHELGRPLGALGSAIHALRGGADQDPTLHQELLVGMEDEVTRLEHLLDDLAQLHKQVLGALELERRPITLSTWLPHVLAPWREAAQSKGLNWRAEIPADLPTLEADPDRLAQAIGNLVSNAIKYTPPQGTVTVGANQADGAVRICVSDNGPGIPSEDQAQIFNALYRGRATGRFPQGMGLGLNIARELVVAHGGRIDVASEPDHGSQFTIWIPQQTGSNVS
jgi:signal transduction histidine kinase